MLAKEEVLEALRECYDPELPVNIVDLGLVYGVEVEEDRVRVEMTLTAPACRMGTMMAAQVEDRLLQLSGCSDARVDIVWEPKWCPEMMSEHARRALGID